MTLYEEVANTLLKDIEEGRHVVGSLLPTELELGARFGVSRQTVRAALTILQDQGYISRKKAVGSLVESTSPSSAYHQVFDTIEDLVRTATETEVRLNVVVKRISLDKATARRIGGVVGSEWFLFSGARVRARQRSQIVSWANIFIDSEFEAIVKLERENRDVLMSTLLERECGVSIVEIRQTIAAGALPSVAADAFKAKAGDPALSVLRHFKDKSGRILEISETIYPGDRVSISTRMRRFHGS